MHKHQKQTDKQKKTFQIRTLVHLFDGLVIPVAIPGIPGIGLVSKLRMVAKRNKQFPILLKINK